MYRAPRVSRLRRERRKKTAVKFLSVFALLVFIFGGIIYLSYRPQFSIKTVEVEGAVTIGEPVVGLAKKPLEEKLFYIFPRKNMFLYPVEGMEALLLESFPALSSVSIKRQAGTIVVTAEERVPFGIFCPMDTEGVASTECFAFDGDGYIFSLERDLAATSTVNLPRFEKRLTTLSPLKTEFLSREKFSSLKQLLAALYAAGLSPNLVRVEEVGDYSFKFADGGTVLFAADGDPKMSVQTLKRLLESDEFKKQAYTLESVEYIDVRFGGKIYYKP